MQEATRLPKAPSPKPLAHSHVSIFSWEDILSWSSVEWYVALLVGVWGALLGTGDYNAAIFSFFLATVAFCFKWGHITRITVKSRRTGAFAVGVAMATAIALGIGLWTHYKSVDATKQQTRLIQLDLLPDLKQKADQLPRLTQEVGLLKKEISSKQDLIDKKQDRIESLTQVVIDQDQQIASKAHKQLADARADLSGQISATQTALATNINQYRTDETTAVSRIMRPPRTLGDKRQTLIDHLRTSEAREVIIFPARGDREAMDFAGELQEAFREAGWSIKPTPFMPVSHDGVGLELLIKSRNGPFTPDQTAIAIAFDSIGMKMIGAEIPNLNLKEATEVYVGLQ